MAYTVDTRVRVASQKSQWRGLSGVVKAVDGDNHEIRLDGHGCKGRELLTTDELKPDTRTAPYDYSRCS